MIDMSSMRLVDAPPGDLRAQQDSPGASAGSEQDQGRAEGE